jgi:hypothetical protein
MGEGFVGGIIGYLAYKHARRGKESRQEEAAKARLRNTRIRQNTERWLAARLPDFMLSEHGKTIKRSSVPR